MMINESMLGKKKELFFSSLIILGTNKQTNKQTQIKQIFKMFNEFEKAQIQLFHWAIHLPQLLTIN